MYYLYDLKIPKNIILKESSEKDLEIRAFKNELDALNKSSQEVPLQINGFQDKSYFPSRNNYNKKE